MSDIYLVPESGTEPHDIHTIVSVLLVNAGGGNYPVGLQAWLQPVVSTPVDLNITMGNFTQLTTYGTWQFSRSDWDNSAGTVSVDGYKLVTLTVNNPTYSVPLLGDKIGFDLVSNVSEQWNLKSAPFVTTRTVTANAIPVPEPSTWAYSLFAGVVLIVAALKRGNR